MLGIELESLGDHERVFHREAVFGRNREGSQGSTQQITGSSLVKLLVIVLQFI